MNGMTVFLFAAIASVAPAFAERPAPNAAQMRRIREGVEVYGIVHWGLNTYTDREWGFGDENPEDLNPVKFDADQIVGACKAGGLQGLIVVAKHHDGFCLWPTKTTEHNISKSPFRDGKGDYVKEMERACRKFGLKFGVYVSPWDRNNALYGTEKYVTDVFQAQIRELLSGDYGEIFEMWFDGANGGDGYYGGARERRKIPSGYYRYETETFAMVRKLQPNVCIFNESDLADFRFGGNEQGIVDPDSRSTGGHYDGIWDNYKKWANTGLVNGTTFHPIEADFPLRPGWFYHAKERGKTKNAAYLMQRYLATVGNAATLNLGIAPNREGMLGEEDVKALRGFGTLRSAFFSKGVDPEKEPFNVVVMREDVERGEQVDDWRLEVDGRVVASGRSIGIKRIRVLDSPVLGACKVVAQRGTESVKVKTSFYAADVELVKLISEAATESGETDTAKWMTKVEKERKEVPGNAGGPEISVEGCAEVRIVDDVVTVTSTGAVSFARIKWAGELPQETKVLNDAWERSYGDLEWKNLAETRLSPWYYLANVSNRTWGVGVETGPGAMCCWEVTTNGTTLILDLRAGGQPVRLGGRTLKACRLVRAESREDESAWDFGRRFCKMMCPKPKLPKSPVYGYNDWYCAYGKNTATNFLADAAYIMECTKGCANPPYVVMDDGWQKNSPPVVHESGRGPWDAAGPNFGMDMPTFCRRIAALGAKPGLWYRPLRAWDGLSEDQRLLANCDYLDPAVPAVRARIVEDLRRFRKWGFKLVKIDFLSYDLAQIWPCDKLRYADRYIQDDRMWRDCSRTTAEVMRDLYQSMKDAVGDDVVIIGCNAFSHLAAGVFELLRTGDDTSGREWLRTKKNGINTLAMRSIQDGVFFKVDADCVGLAEEGAVPWELNRRWMDLLGRSGTPFFVSWRRQLAGPEVRKALADSFRRASSDRPMAEPIDWFETRTPTRWRDGDGVADYEWE